MNSGEMDSGDRPLLIQTPNGDQRDGRTVTGQMPDSVPDEAGHTPDEIQVAHVTPDLTRSVRDGVFLQMRR